MGSINYEDLEYRRGSLSLGTFGSVGRMGRKREYRENTQDRNSILYFLLLLFIKNDFFNYYFRNERSVHFFGYQHKNCRTRGPLVANLKWRVLIFNPL